MEKGTKAGEKDRKWNKPPSCYVGGGGKKRWTKASRKNLFRLKKTMSPLSGRWEKNPLLTSSRKRKNWWVEEHCGKWRKEELKSRKIPNEMLFNQDVHPPLPPLWILCTGRGVMFNLYWSQAWENLQMYVESKPRPALGVGENPGPGATRIRTKAWSWITWPHQGSNLDLSLIRQTRCH